MVWLPTYVRAHDKRALVETKLHQLDGCATTRPPSMLLASNYDPQMSVLCLGSTHDTHKPTKPYILKGLGTQGWHNKLKLTKLYSASRRSGASLSTITLSSPRILYMLL